MCVNIDERASPYIIACVSRVRGATSPIALVHVGGVDGANINIFNETDALPDRNLSPPFPAPQSMRTRQNKTGFILTRHAFSLTLQPRNGALMVEW